ncbi:MAG: DUF1036 domain-containing protein [Pseudomonadota bacterium]
MHVRPMRFVFAAFFMVVVCAVAPARAEYALCNKTSYVVKAAMGYLEEGRTVTRGWWLVRPGACQIVPTGETLDARYYVYAEAIDGHLGEKRVWRGEEPFCIAEEDFVLRDHQACKDEPRLRRDFFAVDVDTENEGRWRTEFTEAAGYTTPSAEIAGVQRLLSDLGYDVGEVDGSMGRRTSIAISAFKGEKQLPSPASSVITDGLVDALIAEANVREEQRGLFLCNKTKDVAWSAIAAPAEGDAYVARGWWRLRAEECAKVVKGAPPSDHYFVYAVLEKDAGDASLTDGEKEFCTNTVLFEIEEGVDCEAEGYDVGVFRRIFIGETDAWTENFTRDDF